MYGGVSDASLRVVLGVASCDGAGKDGRTSDGIGDPFLGLLRGSCGDGAEEDECELKNSLTHLGAAYRIDQLTPRSFA